jgi:superfamily I DNA/RNA helicase
VAETINVLLNATRAHAGFAMRPSGEQVLANVMRVAELAREYESSGGTSFRGFVEQLVGDAERGRQAEAAIYEEGADGVRLMSVHKAKGLEFSRVVINDVSDGSYPPPSSLKYVLPEDLPEALAKARSLLYVAASRARDELVVTYAGEPSDLLRAE